MMAKLCNRESVQGEYERVNMRVRAHTRGCMYICMCMYVCMYVCTGMYVPVFMCTCICVRVFVCTCVCVCVCVCARARERYFVNSTDRHWFMKWSNAKVF